MNLFDADIQLRDAGNSRFVGSVSDNWSVNGNPNGGYLMAMIANAMLRKSDKKDTPTVTANYISRCVPGDAEISVNVRNLPKTDRLKCSLRTRFITCGLLEADGEVWDEEGNLAAISRQIAQFRKE
ncbi:MAG: hypothetical protein IH628_15750 [Proteobacteria bacterium]|nr:hypothetical protein [Pseudomonadota bacterium]